MPVAKRQRKKEIEHKNLWQKSPRQKLNTKACGKIIKEKEATQEGLAHRTRDWKVAGLSPGRSGRRIVLSRVNFLCWLLFWYLFDPCVTAVAHKRSQTFCQKCRWQITAKHSHTPYICGFAWSDMTVHGCMVYTEHAETAAVSHGTSHVTTKHRFEPNTTIWMDIQNVT